MDRDAQPVLLETTMILEIEAMVPESERAAFIGEIFGLFLSAAPVTIVEINQACAGADAKALEASAHRLKGSCLSIGALALAARCEVLEKAGRERRLPPDLTARMAEIHSLFTATETALAAHLAARSA